MCSETRHVHEEHPPSSGLHISPAPTDLIGQKVSRAKKILIDICFRPGQCFIVGRHRIEVRHHPSLLQLKTGTFVALKSAMKSVEHKCQMAVGKACRPDTHASNIKVHIICRAIDPNDTHV